MFAKDVYSEFSTQNNTVNLSLMLEQVWLISLAPVGEHSAWPSSKLLQHYQYCSFNKIYVHLTQSKK